MLRSNSKRHKSFLGGIERIKDEPHSDRSLGVKWHNMAEPAMMTGSGKALSDLWKCKWSENFHNIMN